MANITGDALFRAVTSNDEKFASQLILELKAHIKRDLVNLSHVPKYFEALVLAYHKPSLTTNSFSTICHLVKRVSIQDSKVLKLVDFQVVPFLIDRLNDEKPSLKNTAKKAMLTYWQAVPNEFETSLKSYGLHHFDLSVRYEVLKTLCEVVDNTPGFSFKNFLPETVMLLDDKSHEVSNAAFELLVLVFKIVNPNNRTAKSDLISQLVKSRVSRSQSIRVLNHIDDCLVAEYTKLLNQASFVSAGPIKVTTSIISNQKTNTSRSDSESKAHDRPKSKIAVSNHLLRTHASSMQLRTASNENSHNEALRDVFDKSEQSIFDPETEPTISEFLKGVPLYSMQDSLKPINFSGEEQLSEKLNSLKAPFQGKETEFNWTLREQAIVQLRCIIRGNAITEYQELTAQFLKMEKDCICKAVSSLRTTLSSHGCQLCKELGIRFGSYLDNGLVDSLVVSLIKLTSSRKTISQQNANAGVIGLLINSSYNQRLVNQITIAAQDKNAQPRAYAGTWLHILLVKFRHNKSILDNAGFLDPVERIIAKGVGDPSPAVRDSMRAAFWCLNTIFPSICTRIVNRLDSSTLRALEKAKPKPNHQVSNQSSMQKANNRPSMKELILSRQKEALHSSAKKIGSEAKTVARKRSSDIIDDGFSEKRNNSLSRVISSGSDNRDHIQYNEKENEDCEKKEDHTGTFTLNIPVDKIRRHTEIYDLDSENEKRERQIYDLLSSDEKGDQIEGVKKLMNGAETYSLRKFSYLANRLSVINPSAFFDYCDHPDSFHKLCSILEPENSLRMICCYSVNHTLSSENLTAMAEVLQSSGLVSALNAVLDLCIDASSCDDINLSMQFVKNRVKFLDTCYSVVDYLLRQSQGKLYSHEIKMLLRRLFKSWEVVQMEPTKLVSVLETAFETYKSDFIQCFNEHEDRVLKRELRNKMAFEFQKSVESPSSSLHENFDLAEMEEAIADGLTMVVGNKFERSNDVKSDMTMIMPNFKKQMNSRNQSELENPFVEIINNQSVDLRPNYDISQVFQDQNELVRDSNGPESLDDKMETDRLQTMSDNTPDLNQLTIADNVKDSCAEGKQGDMKAPILPSKASDEITSALVSADPLSQVTGLAKVEIYNDSNHILGLMDSWTEFEIYKISKISYDVSKSELLLEKLLRKSITDKELFELASLLNHEKVYELKAVQQAALDYISSSPSSDHMSACLLILRFCILNNNWFEIGEVFHKLIRLYSECDSLVDPDELLFAISETLDLIPFLELYVEALENRNLISVAMQVLLLDNLRKHISPVVLNQELVFRLDMIFYKFLHSQHTAIRRSVIMIYAVFQNLKDQELLDRSTAELVNDLLLKKLNESKLKLVKEYTNEVR
ncbi:hypothetical protein KL933_005326 [Ogataea haglerorum]|uniref:Protein STU1 n=1 Tax=Ogataea haglerorum TaxID=1937702 RepID=A0AAN6D1H6_9ASCO|nr:hypothetical protein KL950_005334 [Ogataea haglerorum]KAG7723851.1 hypothetical protein KL933_005326 [Ogataea haglerorum]KAG7724463.1 hypothetical protein KL948_005306 [Ogataea haglerorum]KAG7733373.1 hypothetical protein KL932_005302 [Ogataea haglerorum]KAG7735868.1 hypothetical protein KL923_005292 [Ogataea haglerorum]